MDNKRLKKKKKPNILRKNHTPHTVLNVLLPGVFQTEAQTHNDASSRSIIYAHLNEMFKDKQRVHLSI